MGALPVSHSWKDTRQVHCTLRGYAMYRDRIPAPAFLIAALGLILGPVNATAKPGTTQFTRDQAERGKALYSQQCLSCHGANLKGSMLVPGIGGEGLLVKWGEKPVSVLLSSMQRMPPQSPGTLKDGDYSNLLAYMLQDAGIAASKKALPTDLAQLSRLQLPAGKAYGAKQQTVLQKGETSPLLKALTAVTTEELNDPAPADWPSWGRSSRSLGYSPLATINRENVNTLSEAWRLNLPPGNNMPTPLIKDGVMFFYTFPDTVLAMDASSGELLWRHEHIPDIASSRKMGLALYDKLVLVPTSDMRMLALDAQTGKQVWNTRIDAEAVFTHPSQRFDLRAAPIIAGDKVIVGVVGSLVSTGSFIVALDARTGAEAWRFYTLARPGTPGGNSWNDLPLEQRSGGSVWIPGSYDATLKLVYFGVAPTYDTQPLTHPVDKDGVSNDALYTNSTLALNPDTGALVWHFQHMPNDQWDLDWTFERQLIDLPAEDGKLRRAVATTGKSAIVEVLDAKTGGYLFSLDSGVQNVIAAIDPVTGAKTINPDTFPRTDEAYSICPSSPGSRSWPPSSYNPDSGRLFLPLNEGCFKAGKIPGSPLLMTGINVFPQSLPTANDDNVGHLQVMDLHNRKPAWQYRQQAAIVSSVLATGGGLVFAGDLEPSLKAWDEATGELVWQTPLDDNPSSSVVTYAINGRQYLAVVVGQTNNHVRDWKAMSQGYASIEEWKVPAPADGNGPAIVVYSLEED